MCAGYESRKKEESNAIPVPGKQREPVARRKGTKKRMAWHGGRPQESGIHMSKTH